MAALDRTSALPLHAQLAERIAERIAAGDLPVGAPLPSIRALIAEYGVSLPVVRRALAALREDGVIATAQRRGSTVRRPPARAPAQRAVLVLLCGRSSLDPFFARVLVGVERAATRARRPVLFRSPADAATGSLDRLLGELRPAGVVATGDVAPATCARLARAHVPLVLAGSGGFASAPPSDVAWVGNDDDAGGHLAARCLIAAGHRHLAVVTGPTRTWYWRERRNAFVATARAAGIEPIAIEAGADSSDSGRAAVARLLATAHPPTGLFAGNDRYAHGAYRALAERRAQAGRDLAIVGFDDLDLAATLLPPLTTVRCDIEAMGEDAVTLLEELLAGGAPRRVVRPVTLIERASVVAAR